jgi:group I intron endonuclease
MAVIYQIKNLISNKCYIGSTCNFKKRIQQHLSKLRDNIHANIYLQASYNKYKECNFDFQVLANCPVEYQFKLEQWFLNNLNPEYNLSKYAVSTYQKSETEITILNKRLGQIKRYTDCREREKRALETRNRWLYDDVYSNKIKQFNSLENHPQSKIDNTIARLIKLDILNKVKRSCTIEKFKISLHIYKDIQAGRTWKTINIYSS